MTDHQNNEIQALTNRDSKLQLSFREGINTWFDVDGMTIHVWFSSWSGRAIVRVEDDDGQCVVSDKRTFRTLEQHAFKVGNNNYRLKIIMTLSRLGVFLYRNDELIDSDCWDEDEFDHQIDQELDSLNQKYGIAEKYARFLKLIKILSYAAVGYLAGVFTISFLNYLAQG